MFADYCGAASTVELMKVTVLTKDSLHSAAVCRHESGSIVVFFRYSVIFSHIFVISRFQILFYITICIRKTLNSNKWKRSFQCDWNWHYSHNCGVLFTICWGNSLLFSFFPWTFTILLHWNLLFSYYLACNFVYCNIPSCCFIHLDLAL